MKNIAVVMGGYSAEEVISFKSGEVVLTHLQSHEFEVYKILINNEEWSVIHHDKAYPIDKTDFSILIGTQKITFDVVFVAIHGSPGEDGILQHYLDRLHIPYTTSGYEAAKLSFNKGKCNDFLRSKGILCAQSYLLQEGQKINIDDIIQKIGLPCFVKPNKNGSSFGISKVSQPQELLKAIHTAFHHDDEILIETFLKGTEVTCGIHNFNRTLTTFPATEIVSENDFFDFEAKYNGKSQEITPARISKDVAKKVAEKTKEIYQLLGLDGIARIDYIIQQGQPYVIEANTVPGLSEESIIPQQAKQLGISLKELFTAAVKHALKKVN